jgi:small subunit ribosomal protein S9
MTKKIKDIQYYEAIGRRKEAVARVRLYIIEKDAVTVNGVKMAKGAMVVNEKPIETFFGSETEKKRFMQPLELTNNSDRFACSIHLDGGGKAGQLEAIIHGISRALCIVDPEEYKTTLKKYGFLTRDPRKKERRKVGTGGKARRAKQSPKR